MLKVLHANGVIYFFLIFDEGNEMPTIKECKKNQP